MLRGLVIGAAAAMLVFGLSSAHAQRGPEEAGDRFTEAMLSVEYTDVINGGAGTHAPSRAVLMPNPGNASALVLGCARSCQAPRVRVRVAGMPELVAVGRRNSPQTVVLQIPATYARSLSNLEVQFDLNCDDPSNCPYQWALLESGPEVPLHLRGLPQSITEAQWSAAADLRPQWRQRPNGDDLRFYYPVDAWHENRGGSARLQCLVAGGGALNCRVSQEDPGFGEAALKLATLLRVNEADAEGRSAIGRRVSVPIVFQPVGS